MLQRAYDILEPFFEDCIADDSGQGLFSTKDKYRKVLNSMPNDSIRSQLDKEWQANERTGAERW
jgi:hypothetical protein